MAAQHCECTKSYTLKWLVLSSQRIQIYIFSWVSFLDSLPSRAPKGLSCLGQTKTGRLPPASRPEETSTSLDLPQEEEEQGANEHTDEVQNEIDGLKEKASEEFWGDNRNITNAPIMFPKEDGIDHPNPKFWGNSICQPLTNLLLFGEEDEEALSDQSRSDRIWRY